MSERASLPTIGPLLWYRDPRAAIAWLERAFGFETRIVVEGADGGVIHSELTLGDGYLMVVGPPSGTAASPADIGRATASVHVQLPDGLDAHCERARAAGAAIGREAADQPYGDRVYTCTDLEGHPWSFGQTVRPMTAAEMAEATGHRIEETARD